MIYEGIDIWNFPYLEHHGVKGMRWGIRHDPEKLIKKNTKYAKKIKKLNKKNSKDAKYVRKKLKKSSVFTKDSERKKAYNKERKIYKRNRKIKKLTKKILKNNKSLKNLSKEISMGKEYLNMQEEIKNMSHTDMLVDEFLAHYGVKGMRWGIRHDPVRLSSGAKKIGKAAVNRGRKILAKAFDLGKIGSRKAKKTYKVVKAKKKLRDRQKLDKNIAKAINSGNPERVDKYFSKMSDAQVNSSLKRISDRSSIKNSISQKKYQAVKQYTDYIIAKNNYMKAKSEYNKLKHPNLSQVKERGKNATMNVVEKMVTNAAVNYIHKKYPSTNSIEDLLKYKKLMNKGNDKDDD